MEIDFSHVPCKYWSDNVKMSYLQRRIIVYSIAYYELNETIVNDKQYDDISRQLVRMMKECSEEECKKTDYWYCMSDFDGSTGFDLFSRLTPQDQHYLFKLTKSIININKYK